ncbi:uncharacterized protein LOC115095049 isoform X1 [Rhinatrema bivittatum]|uniref:uncharacterized protein LOC115095049 isoform X1 n=1 Tax=Rhinatrema bivittatum TaxID=194408 RepID=UPI00112AED25|nr:uncharacterized protein LOC115095049 isoform X1 [Rhinatrema bivittatum]
MDLLQGLKLNTTCGQMVFGKAPSKQVAFENNRPVYLSRTIIVGRTVGPEIALPKTRGPVCQKQYRIPGGHKEITETIKVLQEAGVLIPTTSGWNNPIWSVKKSLWKAVVCNPHTNEVSQEEEKGKSSKFAELYAIWMALQKGEMDCHIYTDSWAVMKGMTQWMPKWRKDQWKIHHRLVWGTDIWQNIWAECHKKHVTVFHVDAHVKDVSLSNLYNSIADKHAKLRASVTTTNEQGLWKWAHEKSGHWGRKLLTGWLAPPVYGDQPLCHHWYGAHPISACRSNLQMGDYQVEEQHLLSDAG